MVRRWLILGIALFLLAAVLFLIALLVPFPAGSMTVGPGNAAWSITPATGSSQTVTLRWSGATATTTVYLLVGAEDCSQPTGIIASGNGSSGALTATLRSGTTYAAMACNGTRWQTATFTLWAVGAPAYALPIEAAAGFCVFFGIVSVFVAVRRSSFGRIRAAHRDDPNHSEGGVLVTTHRRTATHHGRGGAEEERALLASREAAESDGSSDAGGRPTDDPHRRVPGGRRKVHDR